MTAVRIREWSDCHPGLAAALKRFVARAGPYSTASKKRSIFRLVEEEIDPAWDALREDPAWAEARRVGAAALPFSSMCRKHGWSIAESTLKHLVRWHDLPNEGSIDALLDLVHFCKLKRPKKTRDSTGLDAQRARFRSNCAACEKPTELSAYLQTQDQSMRGRAGNLVLSSKFCQTHRPTEGGSSKVRSPYFRAARAAGTFEKELERIDNQITCGREKPWPTSGDELIDQFIHRLIAPKILEWLKQESPPETLVQMARKEVRLLIENKITDRKKQIVSLLCRGHTQTEIASKIGTSQQNVSAAIKSIRTEYRLDLSPCFDA